MAFFLDGVQVGATTNPFSSVFNSTNSINCASQSVCVADSFGDYGGPDSAYIGSFVSVYNGSTWSTPYLNFFDVLPACFAATFCYEPVATDNKLGYFVSFDGSSSSGYKSLCHGW